MNLCGRCNEPATVHMTEISGGNPHEIHLCGACANKADHVQQPKPSLHMRLPNHRLEIPIPLNFPAGYRLRQYETRDVEEYIALMHAGELGAWDAARVQSTFE